MPRGFRLPVSAIGRAVLGGWLVVLSGTAPLAQDAAEALPEGAIRQGDVEIADAWVKARRGGGHVARLFFEFRNTSEVPDRIVRVTSPLSAGRSRFWLAPRPGSPDDQAQALEALPVPGNGMPLVLTEVGYYIELTDLQVPLPAGARVPVTIEFERAGPVSLIASTRFHSPDLTKRIADAVKADDLEALEAIGRSAR